MKKLLCWTVEKIVVVRLVAPWLGWGFDLMRWHFPNVDELILGLLWLFMWMEKQWERSSKRECERCDCLTEGGVSNSGVYISIPNIITKSLPTLQNSYLNPTIHPQSFYQHLLHYLPPTGTLTHTIIFITFSIHFQKSYYQPLISPFSKSFHNP